VHDEPVAEYHSGGGQGDDRHGGRQPFHAVISNGVGVTLQQKG
jgi:hypothetical protein